MQALVYGIAVLSLEVDSKPMQYLVHILAVPGSHSRGAAPRNEIEASENVFETLSGS